LTPNGRLEKRTLELDRENVFRVNRKHAYVAAKRKVRDESDLATKVYSELVFGLSLKQRIREEQLDRVAFVGAVAASIGVEIAGAHERIELSVSHAQGQPKDAVLPPKA
jgi:hypothetical protein